MTKLLPSLATRTNRQLEKKMEHKVTKINHSIKNKQVHSIRLPLIKYGNIALTIITIPLAQSPSCLLLLVRLGGYIVNSLDSYSYHPSGLFHVLRSVFSAHLKETVDITLTKTVVLRINLNIDGTSITSRTHTHPSHSCHNS